MSAKILIESYNCVTQNVSGGVQIKISKFIENYCKYSSEIKLFDKWRDKITDYNVLHIFKANIEDYQLMNLAKNNKVPVVISAIIPLENKIKIFLSRLICKFIPIHTGYWYLSQILLKSDAVITETQKEADFINRYYKIPNINIYVIPNGVDVSFDKRYKELFSKKTGIKEKYVLQVGRFDKNKNQLSVIKAMSGMNIPIVFIGGEDSGRPEYYEQCKKEAGSNIHFLGWLEHDDPLLLSAYQNAHVVVMPSYKETFGICLIEGGAAGSNLIASKGLPIYDWGISEICQTIKPYDIEDIRKKIYDAYNKPLNPHTSTIIREKFSWDSVIKQHVDLYNKVLNEVQNDYI